MAVIIKPGDASRWVPAGNVLVKAYRFFRSNVIHLECGGRWRITSTSLFGHTSVCDRCGREVYETD